MNKLSTAYTPDQHTPIARVYEIAASAQLEFIHNSLNIAKNKGILNINRQQTTITTKTTLVDVRDK